MKKSQISIILKTILLVLMFGNSVVFPHSERVHQFMAREAYRLLKKYNNNIDIPALKNHLGINETGGYLGMVSRGIDFEDGTICAGAFREDVQDIVYGYGNGLLITDINKTFFSSVSHFWNADPGDHFPTNLSLVPYTNIPNAFEKMCAYKNGLLWLSWSGTIKAKITVNGEYSQLFDLNATPGVAQMYYADIIDFYKTGKVFIPTCVYKNSTYPNGKYYSGWLYLERPYIDRIAFEIIGRMTHLIGDMSVPAHVHNQSHPFSEYYEKDFMGVAWDDDSFSNPNVTYWNADRVWNTFGSIMYPYVSNDDPFHFLMYTVNQLADHFPSSAYPGNNTFNSANAELAQYFPYNVFPMQNSDYHNHTPDLINIRDATFPHAIRAVAGFLYWFAKEADLFPKPLAGVSLGGTSVVYAQGTGYWWVSLLNGLEPFTYNWEIKYVNSTYSLKGGKIGPRLLPSNEWVPVYCNTSNYNKKNTGADPRNYYLRCTVTDAGGTIKVSNEYFVEISQQDPPLSQSMIKNNENAQIKGAQIELLNKTSENGIQSYPNPFNPTTVIKYSLETDGPVELKIYNVLSQEVASLVNETKSSGTHQVSFNAGNLPSGIYIARLKTGTVVKSIKLQLIK